MSQWPPPLFSFDPKLKEFYNCLKQWQHRKLTLIGKVTVIKTFALPKLIYPFSVLENPPESKIKEIENAIFHFISEGKPDKIRQNIIKQKIEKGGLKLTDISYFLKSIKASLIKRYLNVENNSLWKLFVKHKLIKYGNELVFECNISNHDVNQLFPPKSFINNMLGAWFEINNIYMTKKCH